MYRGWTIQPWQVWERVERGESLTVDWRYAANLHIAYDWLREELTRRVAGYGGHYPWWAYGERPDLRVHRHNMPFGEPFVLLELELPEHQALPLAFWAWDLIFQNHYVAPERDEALAWQERMLAAVGDEDAWPLPEPWRSELFASWERLFDPALPRQGWSFFSRPATSSVEYVFERLERAVVRRATPFRGTRRDKSLREPSFGYEYLDGPTQRHRDG